MWPVSEFANFFGEITRKSVSVPIISTIITLQFKVIKTDVDDFYRRRHTIDTILPKIHPLWSS